LNKRFRRQTDTNQTSIHEKVLNNEDFTGIIEERMIRHRSGHFGQPYDGRFTDEDQSAHACEHHDQSGRICARQRTGLLANPLLITI
jgi:hypothetical protein